MQFRDILISPLPLNDPHNPQIDLIYVYPMTEIEISLMLIIYTLSPYHVWGEISIRAKSVMDAWRPNSFEFSDDRQRGDLRQQTFGAAAIRKHLYIISSQAHAKHKPTQT